MGFSKSFALLRSQQKADRKFVENKINPTGQNSGTNSLEALGASINLSNLRSASSNTTKSRMSLPLSDVARSGSLRFGETSATKPAEVDDNAKTLATRQSMWNQDIAAKNAIGNQDINLNIRRVKEYDTLANNEANRALGMDLATKFPYHKYDTEADAFKSVTNNMLSPSRFASLASTQIKPMQYVSF